MLCVFTQGQPAKGEPLRIQRSVKLWTAGKQVAGLIERCGECRPRRYAVTLAQSRHTEDRRDAVVMQGEIVWLGGLSHRTCRGQLPLVEISLGQSQSCVQLELSICRVIGDVDGLLEHLGGLFPRALV